jgi:tryptophan synthase alpha chain
MNRYQTTFTRLAAQRRIAMIPFAVAGDPDLTVSEKIFRTYIDAGADILEIGYPFSDPMADGPINQRAAQRAIEAGITPATFFAMIKRLRSYYPDIPFGLLLYANTINNLGAGPFCRKAAAAGIDSILVADMPPEEAGDLSRELSRNNIASVFIVSELTTPERIRMICECATGFVYVVSRLGTTGIQADLSETVGPTLAKLRRMTSLPLCVGFGLSTPGHVADIANTVADGAIVGSKLVSIIEEFRSDQPKLMRRLTAAMRHFRAATSRPPQE